MQCSYVWILILFQKQTYFECSEILATSYYDVQQAIVNVIMYYVI
jgi:hypothetical protein